MNATCITSVVTPRRHLATEDVTYGVIPFVSRYGRRSLNTLVKTCFVLFCRTFEPSTFVRMGLQPLNIPPRQDGSAVLTDQTVSQLQSRTRISSCETHPEENYCPLRSLTKKFGVVNDHSSGSSAEGVRIISFVLIIRGGEARSPAEDGHLSNGRWDTRFPTVRMRPRFHSMACPFRLEYFFSTNHTHVEKEGKNEPEPSETVTVHLLITLCELLPRSHHDPISDSACKASRPPAIVEQPPKS